MTTTKEKPANPVPQLDGYSKRFLKNCFALLVGKRNTNFYRRGDLILIKLFVTKFSWMKIIIVVLIEIQTENFLQKHFFLGSCQFPTLGFVVERVSKKF